MKPNFSSDQSLTFELLVILGIILVLISPIGEWLSKLVAEIGTPHEMKLNYTPPNPLDALGKAKDAIGEAIFHAPNIDGGGGGNGGGGTSLFNVPIVDANGEAGSIQVVAHDPSSAVNNANQGGNTPTGPAVAV